MPDACSQTAVVKAVCLLAALLLLPTDPSSDVGAGKASASAPGPVWTEPVTGMEFVPVPGGEFMMGSSGNASNEEPPHPVRIASFSLTRLEILQRQWEKVMGENPSRFAGCPDCPVEQVSWEEAQEFLRRAGEMTGLPLRLPTEAEWEYAAGGGATHQQWPGTNSESEAGEFSWYSGSFSGKTRIAGRKLPNLFGFRDMAGNVAEWCADWYGTEYYRESPVDNPRGPDRGTHRVVRGGSWLSGPKDLRVARRTRRSPDARSPAIGFRVALDPQHIP